MKYSKIVIVFPGQGSQYVGMGKEFYDKFKLVRDIYKQANEVLGYDLAEQCFRKPSLTKGIIHRGDLNRTIYTQPAVFTTGYACYRVLEETCKECDVEFNPFLLAGHSLGEYTALAVSKAMDFKTCLSLVHKRAGFMTAVGQGYPGAGLMAVLDREKDLDYEKLCALCKDFGVYITLNNTKKQIVVGGSKRRLAELSKELRNGDLRSTVLKVEGPFHTPIMKPAADKLKKELETCAIGIASKPVMANVSADAIVDPNHIKNELYAQIFQLVNWRGSIEKAIQNGGDLFIEVGPKKVLSNMIKDIDSSIPALNVEDMESLENTVKAITG